MASFIWYQMLPEYLRPSKRAANRLEEIRRKYGFPDEQFIMAVGSSPEMTRKVQYQAYENLKKQFRRDSEQAILRKVLCSRMQIPPGFPPGHMWSDSEIDSAMESIHSINDLCDYVIALDLTEPEIGFDVHNVNPLINQILREDLL